MRGPIATVTLSMFRMTLLAAVLGLVLSTPAAAQAADPDLALSQLSWDVVAAMPDRSSCPGVSAKFDTAIAGLLADARMQQIKSWFAFAKLPMPPRSPNAILEEWTAQSCLEAVQAVLQLLDENEEAIQRMAQKISG